MLRTRAGSALLVYSSMVVLAAAAFVARGDVSAWLDGPARPLRSPLGELVSALLPGISALSQQLFVHLLSFVAGLVLAAAVIAHTRQLVATTRWARALHEHFRRLLGPLEPREIATLAVASGVAEELFFRGALQPTLGLVAASAIFGAAHLGPGRRFFTWTLWAGLMGFAFGGLYLVTGSILAPIVAHVSINHENLHFIEGFSAPLEVSGTSLPPLRRGALPALVAAPRRASDPAPRS